MGFVKDIFEGIGDAISGIVDAIGDVFEWVGDAIGGLFENPIGLLVAGAMAFFAAPAALGVVGGLAEGAAGVAAMGVETVAGGASMMGQVLGTGSSLVGGAAAFGEASALAGAAASGLTAAGSGLLEGASSGSSFLADATSAAEAAGGFTPSVAETVSGLAPVGYEVPGAMNTVVQGGGGGFFDSISQAIGFGGGAGDGGGSLGGVTSFLKDNKEIIKMIGQGIEGWQKEEMEKEKLDWQKKVADQAQANWDATHQPYDFSAYDPGANLQAMNQQIFNSGYMSQANQLQRGGYQPQYLINDPNSGSLPNYQNMVAATYNRGPYEEQKA